MRKSLLIIAALHLSYSFSQTISPTLTKVDSLAITLKTDTEDSNKVKHLNELGWELMYENPDTAILLSKKALEIASNLSLQPQLSWKGSGWAKGIAQANSQLGVCYWLKGDYFISLPYFFKALEIREAFSDKNGMATTLNNIGGTYYYQGDYAKALEYYFKALKINEELGNKKNIAANLNNIGIIYEDHAEYITALQYYFKALKIFEELGDKSGMATNYGNTGGVYYSQGESQSNLLKREGLFNKALKCYFKALKLNEELDNKSEVANNLGNIGLVYYSQGKTQPNPSKMEELFNNALEYYLLALKIFEEQENKNAFAADLVNIGDIYIKQKKYKEAEEYLLKGLEISTEIGALEVVKASNEGLSDLYSKTDRYQLAYEHYRQYSIAKDSLFNEEKSKEIGRLEMKNEIEAAEIERERIRKEEQVTENKKKQRKNLLQYSGIVIALLIIGVLLTILGFLKVRPWLAKGVTFFAFLLLFEFLLVLLDPYLDGITAGEPVYKLLLNALVALCIFPLHAFFEKVIVKRLMKERSNNKIALS